MNSTTSDHQTTTAISLSSAAAEKKKSFVLTRKNQKGQVAIFVALIFQVVCSIRLIWRLTTVP
ncbi:MAG: hypothetical protein K0R29_2873 [Pseudobdellovibrio sp.]|nr:hypothetical protein [Pseudobdellovibrio sp.]